MTSKETRRYYFMNRKEIGEKEFGKKTKQLKGIRTELSVFSEGNSGKYYFDEKEHIVYVSVYCLTWGDDDRIRFGGFQYYQCQFETSDIRFEGIEDWFEIRDNEEKRYIQSYIDTEIGKCEVSIKVCKEKVREMEETENLYNCYHDVAVHFSSETDAAYQHLKECMENDARFYEECIKPYQEARKILVEEGKVTKRVFREMNESGKLI